MLLTDSDSAVRQLPRHIGKLVGVVGRIAIAVVADGIDDQLLCDAFIIIETVERLRVLLRTVVFQLGQTEPDEISNSAVEGADVVKIS